jgi:multicomponent Na+:H+ antiporter subunit C
MSIALSALTGLLFAVGLYMMTHRSLTRIILGVGLLGNGVNLLLLVTGGPPGEAPILGRSGKLADSVPQALILTSIVIGFALVSFMLALAWRSWTIDGTDDVEDDVEDRRVARAAVIAESDASSSPAASSDRGASDRLEMPARLTEGGAAT